MSLDVYHHLPEGLLELPAQRLLEKLPRSTLIHVDGAREPELFVSVLLHGNETSGWDGVRRYLQDHPLPARSLSLFIGNVQAAAKQQRVLPHQQDYNRIWKGASGEGSRLASSLFAAIARRSYFAAIDLHNNTGHNPFYSVLTELDPRNMGLAYLFSDKAVFIREPDSTLTQAFAGRAPAVALEVGPVGDARCEERVYDFIGRMLELDEVPAVDPDLLNLYEALARVHICDDMEFGFTGEVTTAPLMLTGGVEAVNFHELQAGTPFGTSAAPLHSVFKVLDTAHRDVTEEFFLRTGSDIVLKRPVVPAMYTTDPFVVRQDCLCYFMQRLKI